MVGRDHDIALVPLQVLALHLLAVQVVEQGVLEGVDLLIAQYVAYGGEFCHVDIEPVDVHVVSLYPSLSNFKSHPSIKSQNALF